jgi:hypothetical protein
MTTPLGENMVKYEINIVPKIIMIKPLTLAVVSGVTGYILVLESIENPLKHSSLYTLKIVEVISYFFLIVSSYESLFNFMIWGAKISLLLNSNTNSNIDLIWSKFPYSRYSWNLVFATKFFFMILLLSIITIIFTNRWVKTTQKL